MEILRLKSIIREKGISGKELAKRVGVTENAISMIVNNKRQPRFDLLVQIAETLNVDIRELFKPTKSAALLNGFVEYDGKVHRIHSREDLEGLLTLLD